MVRQVGTPTWGTLQVTLVKALRPVPGAADRLASGIGAAARRSLSLR